jgi:hypothetical protein
LPGAASGQAAELWTSRHTSFQALSRALPFLAGAALNEITPIDFGGR